MEININIDKIRVILSDSFDRIVITAEDLPPPFPSWLPDSKPVLQIEVAQNYGIQYVKNNFRCIPEVINTRTKKE